MTRWLNLACDPVTGLMQLTAITGGLVDCCPPRLRMNYTIHRIAERLDSLTRQSNRTAANEVAIAPDIGATSAVSQSQGLERGSDSEADRRDRSSVLTVRIEWQGPLSLLRSG